VPADNVMKWIVQTVSIWLAW